VSKNLDLTNTNIKNDLPHFFLVIRISAEDFTNESKSREEELPHEIPATPDDSDDERD